MPERDPWGLEFRIRLSNASIHRRAGRLTEATEQYRAALLCPVRTAEDLPWVYLRLAQIAHEEKDVVAKTWALKQMANADAILKVTSGAPVEARKQGW